MDGLPVEVCYVLPDRVDRCTIRVKQGTTLREAVEQSGLPARHPQLDLDACAVGVFGRVRDPGSAVAAGERIEVYRPLHADPRERRRRAARQG